jgi:hypothetical protein
MGFFSPPPPPPTVHPFPSSFGWPSTPLEGLAVASLLLPYGCLIWWRLFARSQMPVFKTSNLWLYIPAVMVLMPLMHGAMSSWCNNECLADLSIVPSTAWVSLFFQAPLIIFPVTVVEGLFLLFLAQKNPRGISISWFMHLVIASTLACTVFYVLDEIFGKCEMRSVFGNALHPFHYYMWLITMLIDCTTLHILAQSQLKRRDAAELVARQRNLLDALIATPPIFVLAMYANLLPIGGPLNPLVFRVNIVSVEFGALNLVLLSICFASFGLVLLRNSQVIVALAREPGALAPGAASRLLFIRSAIAVKWTFYAVTWALATFKLISGETEKLLLTCLDLGKAALAVVAWALSL